VKRVTLTFDNGPTAGVTEQVLAVLLARKIRAGFFVVGERLERPDGWELARKAHSEGHWIGNHTFTHSAPLGEKTDPEYARLEIEKTQNLIGELAHVEKFFRPMGRGGVIGPHLLSHAALRVLQVGKYSCVLWSSVPGDWKDQDGWVQRCVMDIEEKDWTVVAIHDVENAALPRLDEFLGRLDGMGVEFRQDFPEDVVVMRRGVMVPGISTRIVS